MDKLGGTFMRRTRSVDLEFVFDLEIECILLARRRTQRQLFAEGELANVVENNRALRDFATLGDLLEKGNEKSHLKNKGRTRLNLRML
ncbi:hypothetical protein RJT34_12442 [Clitoria ternatea]|uniref:Uncharacterized protein n=1 Tax=Clitoria ternatea TaxID=43366 RepID=A0AAN9JLQ4_CLITE